MKDRNLVTAIVLTITAIVVSGPVANAGGLSKEAQAHLLNSLKNYKPLDKGHKKRSAEDEKRIEEDCKYFEHSIGQLCYERKYMKDGYYLIDIGFERDESIPVQPRAPAIPNSKPFRRDTTERDAFLKEWSDAVLRMYFGDNYHRFRSLELQMVNDRAVIIELQVSSAEELEDVLRDPRITYVHHVASPSPELEEIVD